MENSMATWWEILNKDRHIKGLSYNELNAWTKSRSSEDASWDLLWRIINDQSNANLGDLSSTVRHWLETHGPKS